MNFCFDDCFRDILRVLCNPHRKTGHFFCDDIKNADHNVTARREDSSEGMLLPAPSERNIRQPYTSDVVTRQAELMIHIPVKPLRNCLLRKSERNHIHIHGLDVSFRQFKLVNKRMGEECTPLIRLHEHTFTVQPDTVRVLIFSFYDFSECHKIRALRAFDLAPGARGRPQNACSGKPATQCFSEHAD